VAAFALANAWEATATPEQLGKVTALLHVDASRTIVNIVTGARLRLTREFPTGGAADTAETSPAIIERLVKQLQLSFDYFENQVGQAVDRLAVGGIGAGWAGFSEHLHEALNLAVERWDPIALVTKESRLDESALTAMALQLPVAFGLSLRGGTR